MPSRLLSALSCVLQANGSEVSAMVDHLLDERWSGLPGHGNRPSPLTIAALLFQPNAKCHSQLAPPVMTHTAHTHPSSRPTCAHTCLPDRCLCLAATRRGVVLVPG